MWLFGEARVQLICHHVLRRPNGGGAPAERPAERGASGVGPVSTLVPFRQLDSERAAKGWRQERRCDSWTGAGDSLHAPDTISADICGAATAGDAVPDRRYHRITAWAARSRTDQLCRTGPGPRNKLRNRFDGRATSALIEYAFRIEALMKSAIEAILYIHFFPRIGTFLEALRSCVF